MAASERPTASSAVETDQLPIFRDAGTVIQRLLRRQLDEGAAHAAFSPEEQQEIAAFAADLQQKALLFQDRVSRILESTDDPRVVAALLDDAYAAVTSLAVWTDEGTKRLLPAIDRIGSR
jgi:hypothetical protein